MKLISLPLLALFIFLTTPLPAQIIGGFKNGQSTPQEIKPAAIQTSALAGDVNLFTGTYHSNYTLGTVSNVSGLSYTLQLSNTSTFTSGDNLPHASGIPYGEGWTVNIPTLSVSVEDYNKYSIWEADREGHQNSNGLDRTKQYYDENGSGPSANLAKEEGSLYWFAPMLTIPGVASGRLVFKYERQGQYVFVLHKFDRYIEAYFDGSRWEIVLEDGTRYEMGIAALSHRNSSNQRVQEECYEASTNGDNQANGGALPNLVLPKTQLLSWYCVSIFNRTKVGRIRFFYNSFGQFNFHKVYRQPRFLKMWKDQWRNGFLGLAPLREVARDIILTEVRSDNERLVLDYESIPIVGGDNMLDFRQAGVHRQDSLYSYTTVYHQGGTSGNFDNWKRYSHLKAANNPGDFPNPATATNPYWKLAPGGVAVHPFSAVSGSELTFQHGYLESDRIGNSANFPSGDIYEVQTKIHSDPALTGSGGALFDINLASGDNTGALPSNSAYTQEMYAQSRGQAVFSTFPQAVKWHSRAVVENPLGQSQLPDLETSNYFVLPNLPTAYAGFNIQVGGANSDNNFALDLNYLSGPGYGPYLCQSYYNYSDASLPGFLNKGDDIPQNFGVGLPWHIMKNFYAHLEIHDDYCGNNSNAPNFWWAQSTDNVNENRPTRLRSETVSSGIYNETTLKEVKVIRYAKNPYMLKRVRKLVHNTGGALLPGMEDNTWHLTGALEMDYELLTTPLYTSYFPPNVQLGIDPPQQEQVGTRNIFHLRKIIQLPLIEDWTTIDKTIQPTTHFDYWTANDLDNFVGMGYAASVWPSSLDNATELTRFNSNYSILEKIIDPLGKETTIQYYKFSESGNRSYSLPNFQYRLRPADKRADTNTDKIRSVPPYSFQTSMVVKHLRVKDEDSGEKIWSYRYYSPKMTENHTPLSEHFSYDDTYSYKFGFGRVDIRGPHQNNKRDGFRHYFYTTEQDALLWGKMYKADKYAQNTELLERQEITYEAVLAFESPSHRKRKFYHRYDYQDYRIENATPDRPIVEDFPTYKAYLTALYQWMTAEAAAVNSNYEAWMTARPVAPVVSSCPLEIQPCNCEDYGLLNEAETQICDDWFKAYSIWLKAEPHFLNDPFFFPKPDVIPTFGMHGAPDFYEGHQALFIEAQDPIYLNSYFIKKTKEVHTNYEYQCTNAAAKNSIITTMEYEYFDANYAGHSDSPGYDAFITDPDFDPTNGSDNGGLAWEPSWQLYSKKTYTNEYATANEAYTLEENFFLYDLANDPRYQINPYRFDPSVYNPNLKTNLTLLSQVRSLHKIRNLPYETRISRKAPGQPAIVQSTYYQYRNDWDADDPDYTINRIENPAGPGSEWPCTNTGNTTSDNLPVGGSGYDPGVIYNEDGQPCIYYHSGNPPPTGDYNCPMDGFYFWYCECGTTGGNADAEVQEFSVKNKTNAGEANMQRSRQSSTLPYVLPDPYYNGNPAPYQIQDPYDDPNDAHLANTLLGKILLEKVWRQVSPGTPEVSTFNTSNFNPQHPYSVQLLRQINSRNRFGQVVEEEDDLGLITRYEFSPANAVEYEDCYQDSIHSLVLLYLNENPGLPASVIIGYGLADALTTSYEYDLSKRVKKITDPNGIELTYDYDDFGRLKNTYRNGTLLQATAYKQWTNNLSQSFINRTYQNYVKTTTHIDAGQSFYEKRYIDPLGRDRGVVRDNEVVLGNPIFNNAGQKIVQLKPAAGTLPQFGTGGNAADHKELEYENHFRSRVLKTSKNGLSIAGSHVMSHTYCSITNTELAADIMTAGLNITTPPRTRFFKTTTTDEDNKSIVEYTNAIGQQMALITLGGTAATVFYYDSQGKVKEVINPKGQSTSYAYNYLGQLYQKNTVDGGTTIYAYNSRGQLLAEKDAKGEIRLYDYDIYGRMIRQAMTLYGNTSLFDNNGMYWVVDTSLSVFYALLNNSSVTTDEKRWYYDSYNADDYNRTPTAVRLYLNYSLTNTDGKLVQSVSCDRDGSPIHFKFFSYNEDGFLKWEIDQFNYNGISANYPGLATRIDYPKYNLAGSVKTQNIDLNCDQSLDLQYYYTYDSWNRLKEVYAQFDNSKATGHKVASYDYDDVKGLVTNRRYFASKDNNCKNIEIENVQYQYDNARFRLTEINSTLFDWKLYYDGAFGPGSNNFPTNYNGNINVSEASYKLYMASNAPSNFLSPTVYNYRYDDLNRLTEANASVTEYSQGPLDPLVFGDTKYLYDKIGNLLSLERTGFDRFGNTENNKDAYYYGSGNNRLKYTRRSVNGGIYSTNRSFTYGYRGNMYSDTKIDLLSTEYGRSNLPWELTKNSNSNRYISYQYDINDARIYKASRVTPTAIATISEYYLRAASGQELGIYDFNNDDLQWYIYGTDRVAKMKHLPVTTWPEGIEHRYPINPSLNLSEESQKGPTVLATTLFGAPAHIDLSNLANQEKLAFVERLKNEKGDYQLPDNLYYLRDKSDGSEAYWLQEEWPNYDSTQYELVEQIPISTDRQRMVFEDEKGDLITLSLGELGLNGLGPEPDPNPAPQDPFTEDLPAINNSPVPELGYYVYDHLGNTRVVYNVDLSNYLCGSDDPIIYNLETVMDYYPYGKRLRGFIGSNGAGRYLTTQHERDEETGYDNRGARLSDADIGRFLSLDPLATIYPEWSPYNYVLSNPIIFVDPDGESPCPWPCSAVKSRIKGALTGVGERIQGAYNSAAGVLSNAADGIASLLSPQSASESEGGDGVAFSADIGHGEETRVNEAAPEVSLNELFDNFSVPGQAGKVNQVMVRGAARADVGTGLDVLSGVANMTNKMVDVSGKAILPGAKQVGSFKDPNAPSDTGIPDTVEIEGESFLRTQVSEGHTKYEPLEEN